MIKYVTAPAAGPWRARNVSREPTPYGHGDDNQMQWKREITRDGPRDNFLDIVFEIFAKAVETVAV